MNATSLSPAASITEQETLTVDLAGSAGMAAPDTHPGARAESLASARSSVARLALIRAGIQEFGEFGPEGASIRKIAQRAGQNIAAIGYYFNGKQGLYHAIAEYIVTTMTRRNGPLLDEISAFLEKKSPPRKICLSYLQAMLQRSFQGSDEMVALSQMIVREQTHPTEAFDVLFKGALERPHRLGTRLIAAYVGGEPDAPEFVIRYHMLLGSVLAFRVARETLLRRLGWNDIPEEEKAVISRLSAEHIEWVLCGLHNLRKSMQRAKSLETGARHHSPSQPLPPTITTKLPTVPSSGKSSPSFHHQTAARKAAHI